jgi:hypothetical protein
MAQGVYWLTLALGIVGSVALLIASRVAMTRCAQQENRGSLFGLSCLANLAGWLVVLWTLDTAFNSGSIFGQAQGQQWGAPVVVAIILATLSVARMANKYLGTGHSRR